MAERTKFQDAVAIVTGAGSGIGRALVEGLARRGAFVVATDLDGDAAANAGGAMSFPLDVRDAAQFEDLAAHVAQKRGRIDLLVNNAGTAVAGEVQDLALAHWERVLDVNLRGTIHGIHAVYPRMLAQGGGHIVNVASLAGLAAGPFLVPYAASKHAVVGLSSSLRIEAADRGVRVSVVCPAAIETPLLDRPNPADLPPIPWRPNMRRFLTKLCSPPYPVDRFAEEALDGVAANRGVIVIPSRARLAWKIVRWLPSLAEWNAREVVRGERRSR